MGYAANKQDQVFKVGIKDAVIRVIAGEDPGAIAANLDLVRGIPKTVKEIKTIGDVVLKKDKALSEIRKGSTIAVAAAAAEVSSALVCRWMKAVGMVSGQKQKTMKALELLKEGKLSVAEIAKEVGLSRAAVYGIKRRDMK